jgi:hypothetical protein
VRDVEGTVGARKKGRKGKNGRGGSGPRDYEDRENPPYSMSWVAEEGEEGVERGGVEVVLAAAI